MFEKKSLIARVIGLHSVAILKDVLRIPSRFMDLRTGRVMQP